MPASSDDDRSRLLGIHRRYGGWIRGRLRKTFPDAWEDMAQEVMMKLGQSLPRLRDDREEVVRAWVARTLRSVCVDEIRRRARRPAGPAPLAEPASRRREGAEDVELADEIARVREQGWSRLSEREQRILTLRFRDGLSFRQIAELLEVPQGSVAGWYGRALRRLREVLA